MKVGEGGWREEGEEGEGPPPSDLELVFSFSLATVLYY